MHSSHILSLSILAIFNFKKRKKPQNIQVHWKDQNGYIENLFEKDHWSEGEQKQMKNSCYRFCLVPKWLKKLIYFEVCKRKSKVLLE